ncbi:S8 family serine peptidase [Leptospira idonii]|uniref:S8 family serine peptidase n=1 Tax=Leptospira idonii TaxID=1193500 RepID=UPI0014384CFD|nr:S8 family serine peptidase [Leptospira idonii]
MKVVNLILLLSIILLIACKKDKKDPLEDLILLLLIQQSVDPSGPDPLYQYQWHLKNNGDTTGSLVDEDARVEAVWAQGIKGNGVVVTVNDDGMDTGHEDLKKNYSTDFTIDYTGQNAFYSVTRNCAVSGSGGYGCHGTSVAGVLGAVENNARGGKGAAPGVKIGARNIGLTDSNINNADAMSKNTASVFISNNSWGYPDGTGKIDFSLGDSLWQAAVDTGVQTGRSGKGTLYFWAGGNGGTSIRSGNIYTPIQYDNSNQDSQANYYGVFAVAALGNDGKKARYSEDGANLLVSAHSLGNSGVAITTTDVTGNGGYNIGNSSTNYSDKNYTNTFSGTSSATPLAAGVAALILEANPNITMRDMRVLLARTARKNDPTDTGWIQNAAGLNFNHKYGFGAVDAASAVTAAKSWSSLGNVQNSVTVTGGTGGGTSVPNNNATGLTNTANFSSSSLTTVEFVALTINISAATENSGDLLIELTSPSATKAVLAIPHVCYASATSSTLSKCTNYANWRFGATTFIDEPANGNWSLKISDLCNYSAGSTTCSNWGGYSVNSTNLSVSNNAHTLNSWSLKIYGR